MSEPSGTPPKKDLTSVFDLPPMELSPETLAEAPVSEAATHDFSSLDSPLEPSLENSFPENSVEPSSQSSNEFAMPMEFSAPEAASEPTPAQTHAAETMSEIRDFSENVSIGKATSLPAYPMTVRIEGHLDIHESTRLLDLIRKHEFGIHDQDLELQIEAGRILLPRISEYAAVLVVQALRGAKANITVLPSEIEPPHVVSRARVESMNSETTHPAEEIPVTQDSRIPGYKTVKVIDVVVASHAFDIPITDPETNSEYMIMVESLTREMKYRAYRKKANAILHFQIQLVPINFGSQHRLMISGTAAQVEITEQ